MPATPIVSWISIAPVKSMALQALTEAEIGLRGIPGDRRFAILDAVTGRLVNAKRIGPLVTVRPTVTVTAAGTHLALRFPDGSEVAAEVEHGEAADGIFYGQPRAVHHVAGPFDAAISAFGGAALRLVEMADAGDGYDRSDLGGSVSIASVAALAELAHAGGLGDPLDQRRFRMTIGVGGIRAYEEDGWLGREVRIGEAIVRPDGNVGRCAVTTLDPDLGRVDVDTLKLLAQTRGEMETTEPLPFGVWASVVMPGRVRLGDPVSPPTD